MNELHADERLSESKLVVMDLVNPNHSGVVKELQWTVCILASSCVTTAANRAWCSITSLQAWSPSPTASSVATPTPHAPGTNPLFYMGKVQSKAGGCPVFCREVWQRTATVAPPSLCSASHANSGLLVRPFAWRNFMQMHFYLCLSTGVMCVIWQRGKNKQTTRKKTSICTHCDAPERRLQSLSAESQWELLEKSKIVFNSVFWTESSGRSDQSQRGTLMKLFTANSHNEMTGS